MKKRLYTICSILLLFFATAPCVNQSVAADSAPLDAMIVVETYLHSLVIGDIPGIKSTLSRGLLRDKAPALDSLSYGKMLRSFYAGAGFSIVNAIPVGSNRTRVNVELLMGNGQTMEASFILGRDAYGNYLIEEELQ